MELEQLTPQEFDAHVEKGTFRLAFVGMSNAGKSYRSKKLCDEAGFLWYEVDKEIEEALSLSSTDTLSSWLGYPTSLGYPAREKEYLALENKCTRKASMETNGKNLVFDTTGSVAQLEKETLTALKGNYLVVHLDVGEGSLTRMIEKFFEDPKPVAWGEYFEQKEGEDEETALRRCYPTLLTERLKKYRSLAHVTILAGEVYDTSAEETLAIIKARLKRGSELKQKHGS